MPERRAVETCGGREGKFQSSMMISTMLPFRDLTPSHSKAWHRICLMSMIRSSPLVQVCCLCCFTCKLCSAAMCWILFWTAVIAVWCWSKNLTIAVHSPPPPCWGCYVTRKRRQGLYKVPAVLEMGCELSSSALGFTRAKKERTHSVYFVRRLGGHRSGVNAVRHGPFHPFVLLVF